MTTPPRCPMVMVGVDGSATSDSALDWAVREAALSLGDGAIHI